MQFVDSVLMGPDAELTCFLLTDSYVHSAEPVPNQPTDMGPWATPAAAYISQYWLFILGYQNAIVETFRIYDKFISHNHY